MELTLAILMVLGIFVGIPAAIGFAIVGVYFWSDRLARRAEHTRAPAERAKAPAGELTGAPINTLVK